MLLPLRPGQIFKISPAGDFTRVSSAHFLRAGVIQARDGRLYGTESGGVVCNLVDARFRVCLQSRSEWHAHGSPPVRRSDNASPVAELVEIDDGSLYGTSRAAAQFANPHRRFAGGTIFRVDPATGAFTTRYRFSGPDGSDPVAPLIQGTDGLIYGTTASGGAFGFGTVFSLDSADTLTTLHHFAGADGANPNAGVIQGLDGRLYGTTTNGGAFGYGTVFVMNVTGGLTTLHDFALSDGANPVNELIQANDGAFYGAAPIGGPTGGGVIFRVRLATSPPDQYVEIVSRNSGQCLDVYGGSTDAAASVIQWTCHGGAESTVAARAGRRRRVPDHRAPQRAGARRLWRAASTTSRPSFSGRCMAATTRCGRSSPRPTAICASSRATAARRWTSNSPRLTMAHV